MARARAAITRPDLDTIRFEAPAAVHHCSGGRGLLFEAVKEGNGLLVWLRPADSAEGEYRILGMRDTLTPRGVIGAVRYMTGDVAHGFSLDSGTARLTVGPERLALRVTGSGLEVPGATRPLLDATFQGLPLAPFDTGPCDPQR